MRAKTFTQGVLWLVAALGVCAAQQSADFDGTWVFRFRGQNILKLTLETKQGGVTGSLTKPAKFSIDQDGDVTELGPGQVTLPVQKSTLTAGRLELTIDDDRFVMTLAGRDRATLAIESFRPWNLERVADGATLTLAASLPQPHYSAEIQALREELRSMVREDQDARMAFDQTRWEAADLKNRAEVRRIFDQYGWITISLAGKDAAHDFWLLVQHQTPEIQRRLLPAMEKAAQSGDASMSDYAYLYDRVQVGLGKAQHWGTQTKCRGGIPVPDPIDDPAGVDARRKELFLPPMQDYVKMDYLTKACAVSGK